MPQDTPEDDPVAPEEEVPASAPEEPQEAPEEAEEEDLTYTEEAELDSAIQAPLEIGLKMLAEIGIKKGHPALEKARNGDFGALEAVLEHLGDKNGKAALGLLQHAFNFHQQKVKLAQAKLNQELYSIAGGKQQFNELLAFAKEHASPEEQEAFDADMKAGGRAAKLAVENLKLYQALAAQRAEQGAGERAFQETVARNPLASASAPAQKAKDVFQYAEELEALYAQGHNDNSPAVQRVMRAWARSR
jgi:hypothetical protein